MPLNHYLIGNKVVMVGSCALVDPLTEVPTLTNPTVVTFIRETPDGSLTTYVLGVSPEVTHLADGIDACTVPLSIAGREKWRYEGVGTCEAAAEDFFDVVASSVI